jgi:hypothetical protein
MFRATYTDLTQDLIGKKLKGVKAPKGGGVSLAGTTLDIMADKDFKVTYKIKDDKNLVFSLCGGAETKAQYAALEIKSVVLFSHLVPGTQAALNVIWNRKTNLVTVFEVWFSGKNVKQAREASCEIYQGYASVPGVDAPEARHTGTNRLENKAIVWTGADGKRTLNIFNATLYCTFLELDDPKGGIPIAAPADYIKITDELFIYSRVEAEFSGTALVEVIDLFTLKNIGVRLGFSGSDGLDYGLYANVGELAGQLATFPKFTDYGGSFNVESLGAMVLPEGGEKKGLRGIYRVHGQYPDFTEEEARNAGQHPHTFPKGGQMLMPTGNSLPDSDFLIGKSFTLNTDDGFNVEYRVKSINELEWRYQGEKKWHEESYRAFECGEELIFFGHVLEGSEFGQCILAAVDFMNGLATVIHSRQGNGHAWREVGYKVHFGVLEIAGGAVPPSYMRHTFTTDLVGKAFTWNYAGGPEGITSMHVYSSPWGYSWTIFLPNQEGGMLWSSPCSYIKLREEAYIMSWVEETSAGGQGTVLMNLNNMHDGGFMFGAHGPDKQVGLSTLGAYGRYAGQLDILKYFQPKVK